MKKRLVWVSSIIILLLGCALVVELTVRRVDTGPLLTYMVSVVVPLVPILFVFVRQEKTLPGIQEVAQQAADDAATAATQATQAQSNTNGIMAMRFDQLATLITHVENKLDHHIADCQRKEVNR